MKVLIGTTNPSKAKRFIELLQGYDIEFLTLKDVNIVKDVEETGKSPQENAIIKANFYHNYFDCVICNDSGLYFDSLPIDDVRQPGLKIRTPKGIRLNDEEMIEYYSSLINSLGGKVTAYYLDAITVYNKDKLNLFCEDFESNKHSAFYMIDKPSSLRHVGWPLDSLSININTNNYFTEEGDRKYNIDEEDIKLKDYRNRLRKFLIEALDL